MYLGSLVLPGSSINFLLSIYCGLAEQSCSACSHSSSRSSVADLVYEYIHILINVFLSLRVVITELHYLLLHISDAHKPHLACFGVSCFFLNEYVLVL